MGFLNNIFGGTTEQISSNVNSSQLQILMKQVKKYSNWTELLQTETSTLSIDKVSCYIDQHGVLFFLWRDIFKQKGDTFYFSLFDKKDNTFYVLKQITQIVKGKEDYSFKEEAYSIEANDPSIQKIINFVNSAANLNSYREPPMYIDGLA